MLPCGWSVVAVRWEDRPLVPVLVVDSRRSRKRIADVLVQMRTKRNRGREANFSHQTATLINIVAKNHIFNAVGTVSR